MAKKKQINLLISRKYDPFLCDILSAFTTSSSVYCTTRSTFALLLLLLLRLSHFGGMFIIKESRGINYTQLLRNADEARLKLLNLCRDTFMGSIY